jgi:hypothetical protein
MVIKVLFSKKINTTHAELPLVLTKFFEVDCDAGEITDHPKIEGHGQRVLSGESGCQNP